MRANRMIFPVFWRFFLPAFLAIAGACTLVGPEAVVAQLGRITRTGVRSTLDTVEGWYRARQTERIAWQREQYAAAVTRRSELTRCIEVLRAAREEAARSLAEDRETLRAIHRVMANQEGDMMRVGGVRCPRPEVERDAYEVLHSCIELGQTVDRYDASIQRLSAGIHELDRQMNVAGRALRDTEQELARREHEQRGLKARAEVIGLLEDLEDEGGIRATPL